jgi:hypothetical protein
VIVVDDRHLFEILAGVELPELGELASAGVATTFSWYFRLSRALATDRVEGSLSTMFAALTDDRRRYVHGLLEDLPSAIEILHPIATLMVLEAAIVVSTKSALMDRAANAAGVECLVVPRRGE